MSEVKQGMEINFSEMSQAEMLEMLAKLQSENEALKAKKSSNSKAKREFIFTPYQATKEMNEARAELGLKEINSPMLYIYARKGAFIITQSEDGRKVVDRDSFIEWMNKHNAKQASNSAK